MLDNNLLNLGSIDVQGQTEYGISSGDQLRDICRRAVADETIQYIAFVFCLTTIAVMFLERKRSMGGAIV